MVFSYMVVSTSVSGGVTTYEVNVSSHTRAMGMVITQNSTAWVESDGTVPLVTTSIMGFPEQYNSTTNPTATTEFTTLMAPITMETTMVGQMSLYTAVQFTKSGPSPQTFGPTTINVTTYQVTNPPVTVNECGFSGTINAFNMQFGIVPGTSITLITRMHMSATSDTGPIDFTLQVTSVTTA
jgi:hypothetical protein